MLEFASRELQLKFNDKQYKLSYPNVQQMKVFSKCKEDEYIDGAIKLLEDCGLPEKVSMALELDHMKAILEELTAAKK